MDFTSSESAAMQRALELAATPGFALSGNPRVGCVLLAPDGTVLGQGFHRGAGTVHAEVDALTSAGTSARGATAVVTLEPCNHTGRTGPCTEALIAAGVSRVVFAQPDPTPEAAGGAARLRAAGIEVVSGLAENAAAELNRHWTFAVQRRRPWVVWKFAASLDGRSAAADGSSQWITNADARADVHRLRAACDTILVGTGTALIDDPALTVRNPDGSLAPVQPMRAVMGRRALPADAQLAAGATVVLDTREPDQALTRLFDAGARRVLLEGGPTLAADFVNAGLVDEVVAYLAPALLGAGSNAVADFGVPAIDEALRLDVTDIALIGPDHDRNVRLTGTPRERN